MNTIHRFLIALLIIAVGFSESLFSQKTATWKGGTPGKAQLWNCPQNWKEGIVPDDFYHVVIPDVSSQSLVYPVLANEETEIHSLWLDSKASLTIEEKAGLVVRTWLFALHPAQIDVRGKLTVLNEHEGMKRASASVTLDKRH